MKYWIDPKINYKTFEVLNNKLSPQDLKPDQMDKVLWELLRDRKINICIDTDSKEDPVLITMEQIPKNANLITNKLN